MEVPITGVNMDLLLKSSPLPTSHSTRGLSVKLLHEVRIFDCSIGIFLHLVTKSKENYVHVLVIRKYHKNLRVSTINMLHHSAYWINNEREKNLPGQCVISRLANTRLNVIHSKRRQIFHKISIYNCTIQKHLWFLCSTTAATDNNSHNRIIHLLHMKLFFFNKYY